MQRKTTKISLLAVTATAAAVFFNGCAFLSNVVSEDPKHGKIAQQDGKIHIKALIDGRDVVYIKGNTIWIQHEAYDFPGKWAGQDLPVTLQSGVDNEDGTKGQKWFLKWNANLAQQEVIKNAEPIPSSGVWDESNFTVDFHTIGYGKTRVIEYPSQKNDYTLKLEFDDVEPNGAHWYSADINWTESK